MKLLHGNSTSCSLETEQFNSKDPCLTRSRETHLFFIHFLRNETLELITGLSALVRQRPMKSLLSICLSFGH